MKQTREDQCFPTVGVGGGARRSRCARRAGELVQWSNASSSPVLSLDTPSGLDTSTGVGAQVSTADATLTLAMPKIGLRSASVVGDLYLADISIPPRLYEHMGLGIQPSPFTRGPIVRIDRGV